MRWKTPDDYKDESLQNSCEYEIRCEIGCTETFFNSGFLKNSVWDRYAEYKLLCKECPHYTHNIGIYFGNGHTTDNIQEKDTVWCRCKIKSREELQEALSFFPKNTKAIFFDDIRMDSLNELEAFPDLECVLIGYAQKLIHFWDFPKTPKFKVLEYVANTHLTDLSELAHAKSLEYFGIEAPVSRVNLTYVDSFAPLKRIPSLKEVSLSSVMCTDNNIDNLIDIPNLEKLWISPHTFSTEDFAKFEARKFKIYEEYGIYQNSDDYVRPLGKGGRCFRSDTAKEKFSQEYQQMLLKYKNANT